MAKSYRRMSIIIKIDELLKLFSEQKGPISGAEAAKAANIPYDTCMCYLATLIDIQWLKQTGDNYELGPKFSFYWSRYRARLLSQASRITQEFNDLEA